jgi:VanZ family protein
LAFLQVSRMKPLLQVVRLIAWSLAVLIVVLSLAPPDMRPGTGVPHNFEHFAIFAACGVAFGLGYGQRPGLVVPALGAFAGAIELAQTLVPGRHARLSDFVVDAAAICIGAAAAAMVGRRVFNFGV